MKTKIYDIQLGMNHCYLIKQEGMVMVYPGHGKAFPARKIEKFIK